MRALCACVRCVHAYMCLCVHVLMCTYVRVGGGCVCVCVCNVYAYLGMCSLWSLPHTNSIMFKEGSLIWSHWGQEYWLALAIEKLFPLSFMHVMNLVKRLCLLLWFTNPVLLQLLSSYLAGFTFVHWTMY